MWPWTKILVAISNLTSFAQKQSVTISTMVRQIDAIFRKLGLEVDDLDIVIGPISKGTAMVSKKATGSPVKCPCLAPKSTTKRAVMPDVVITDPAPKSITLQPKDANGNPVPLTSADTVTGGVTSDNAAFAISAGVDTTHFTATIAANTSQGTVANLAATLKGTIQGAAADLTASVKVTIDIPPSPVAVDLDIIIA